MIEIFKQGGFIMYPLFIFSILTWAIAFEKIWFFAKIRSDVEKLYKNSIQLIKDKKINEARGLGHNLPSLISAPYLEVFEKGKIDQKVLEERISRKLVESRMDLKRYLWILGTIGSSAPFVGLFGTVMGIIRSFESISKSGKGGFSVVAAGISEALVATAAGIVVAVVALLFYNYFQGRLQQISVELKHKIQDLFEELH